MEVLEESLVFGMLGFLGRESFGRRTFIAWADMICPGAVGTPCVFDAMG